MVIIYFSKKIFSKIFFESGCCRFPSSKGSMNWEDQPEAEVVVVDIRLAPEAIRRPHERRIAVPAPAPDNPVRASLRSLRIALRTIGIIIFSIPIRTPFPYITTHIIEPKGIGRKTPYRNGLFSIPPDPAI